MENASSAEHSMLEQALTHLTDAARHLNIDNDVIEKLTYPKESMKARLMVRMDDGSQKSFVAWRCRYDDTRGPTKGGIRFHPDSTIEEVETLAFWMMCKCAVMNLPFGGGKGAVRVDPQSLSRSELERLSRSYVRAFSQMLGPQRDIPAPDVYTNSMIMGWMADEYGSIVEHPCPAVITGKPIALGGSLGRDDATARGGYYLIKHLENELNLRGKDKTVAIQGFGNAGQFIATLLHADGYKIVAVSDSKGAVINKEGLDPHRLIAIKKEKGTVGAKAGINGAEALAPNDLIAVDCDLLVPAAFEDLIRKDNADRITAKVILELANGPITPEADEILSKKKIIVLPDILANAGGVTVSYFEWVQNLQGYYWQLPEIHQRLKTIMEAEGRAIWDLSLEKGTSVRTAAYIHALKRLATAIEAHGTQSFFGSR